MTRRTLSRLLLGTLILVPAWCAASEPPVVVAVDSSRSLSRSELMATEPVLQRLIRSLPTGVPVGMIEFGDTPRWVVETSGPRERVLAALGALEPTGSFTLLHDALVVAAQAMPNGGVIVLATDGRDENSATTADDVARICSANQVRIVAFGVGRRINERALRRLALLTNGSYLGRQQLGTPSGISAAVDLARSSITPPPGEAEPVVAPPAPSPTSLPLQAVPVETPPLIPSWLYLLVAAALIAGAIGIFLWRRQRAEELRVCERCGTTLETWDTECPRCRQADQEAIEAAEKAAAEDSPEAFLDSKVFEKLPLEERLEKTFVLGEQHVIVVKEHRKVARTFVLYPDKPLTVGRAHEVNTVTVSDPTVSAQHFKVVFKEGSFFVVDLGTTNGTYLNGQRVKAAKLKAGDVLRAGEAEFEVRVQLSRRN